jgi:hypothetical protein
MLDMLSSVVNENKASSIEHTHSDLKGYTVSGRNPLCSQRRSLPGHSQSCQTMHTSRRIPPPFINLLYIGWEIDRNHRTPGKFILSHNEPPTSQRALQARLIYPSCGNAPHIPLSSSSSAEHAIPRRPTICTE